MTKIILSMQAGMIPLLILWLSGHDLSRSPQLAITAAVSFMLAIFVFIVGWLPRGERRKHE